jgi:aminoglycoside 6'-N-acetyltransferase I
MRAALSVEISEPDIDHKLLVKNLYVYYRYDLMPFLPSGRGADINAYGVIDSAVSKTHLESVADCDIWWEKPGLLHPFLIRTNGKPAGFAMVACPPYANKAVDYQLTEFFILNRYRQLGVGRIAAGILFDRFPGTWELGWAPLNTPAAEFWETILTEYVGREPIRIKLDASPEPDGFPGYRFTIPAV